jgi:hypothetical protein
VDESEITYKSEDSKQMENSDSDAPIPKGNSAYAKAKRAEYTEK